MSFESYTQALNDDALAAKLNSFSGSELQRVEKIAQAQGMTLGKYLSMNARPDVVSVDNGVRQNVSGMDVATFEVSIIRAASAGGYAGALPAPIGFPYSFGMNYQDLIFDLLDASLGVTTVTVALVGLSLVITFDDGGTNTETLTITCSDVAYPYWLQALTSNYIVCSGVRITVDPAETGQFKETLRWFGKTNFGKTDLDQSLSPNRYVNPQQNQSNVVDITQGIQFGDSRGLVQYIGQNTAASVDLNFFVQDYSRPRF
jgi:hypothetical protein